MKIVLPWPSTVLRPNAREHWSTIAKATKSYKDDCLKILDNVKHRKMFHGQSSFNITFRPPDKRRRDMDGMLSSFKAGLDALSMVCGVDDRHFRYTLAVGEPVKGGAVEITVLDAAEAA